MPETFQLKGGFTTRDRRLDRIPQFDERSRAFPALARVTVAEPITVLWPCDVWLDQGKEGACVGFSIATEGVAMPVVETASAEVARRLYKRAQQLDEEPGENYSGTSVLAGTKAAVELGWYTEYLWAFGVSDLALALSTGPAVLGIPWLTGMMTPDPDGMVHATGQREGGHAICCRGYHAETRRFRLRNSWGRDWGADGDCFVDYSDMGSLLADQGEAMVPVARVLVP